jgi:hypothetical protein
VRATNWPRWFYLVISLCAWAVLLFGLLALALHPILGTLLAIAAMIVLLYAAAAFFRAVRTKRLVKGEDL